VECREQHGRCVFSSENFLKEVFRHLSRTFPNDFYSVMGCASAQDSGITNCRQAPPRPCRHSRKRKNSPCLVGTGVLDGPNAIILNPAGTREKARFSTASLREGGGFCIAKAGRSRRWLCLTIPKNGNEITHTHALSVTTPSCHRLTAVRSRSRSDTKPWCHSFLLWTVEDAGPYKIWAVLSFPRVPVRFMFSKIPFRVILSRASVRRIW